MIETAQMVIFEFYSTIKVWKLPKKVGSSLRQIFIKITVDPHGLTVFFILHKNKHIYHVTDLSKKGEKS